MESLNNYDGYGFYDPSNHYTSVNTMYPEGVVYQAVEVLVESLSNRISDNCREIHKLMSATSSSPFYTEEAKKESRKMDEYLNDQLVLLNYMYDMVNEVLQDQATQMLAKYGYSFSNDVIHDLKLKG